MLLTSTIQVVMITPPALENIGYKLYIIFAVFNTVMAIICWMFYPETSGLPLEAVDELFASIDGSETAGAPQKPWYNKCKWSVIERSKVAVAKAKGDRKERDRIEEKDQERGSVFSSKDVGPTHVERTN